MDALEQHDQSLVDAALMLVLWHRAAPQGGGDFHDENDVGDRLRLMKLAFLAAHRFNEQQIAGLGLTFYRWTWGPLSNQVYAVWELLERAGALHEEEQWLITESGASLSDAFYGEVLQAESNRGARQAFDDIAARWRDEPLTSAIMKHVYGLDVRPAGSSLPVTVARVPLGDTIITPLEASIDSRGFEVDPAWLETLALSFSPSDVASIAAAEEDFRATRFHVA